MNRRKGKLWFPSYVNSRSDPTAPTALSAALLVVAGLTCAPASAVRAQARNTPSTLREVVACVQDALGGARAIAAIESLRMTRTVQPPPSGHGVQRRGDARSMACPTPSST
jgi:hypothetical protein